MEEARGGSLVTSERAEEEKADILKLGRRLPRKAFQGGKGAGGNKNFSKQGMEGGRPACPKVKAGTGLWGSGWPDARPEKWIYPPLRGTRASHGSSKMFFRQPHRQLTISMCRRVWEQMPAGATSTESLLAPETIPTQNSHGIMCVIQPHWHRITLYSQQEIVRKWGWGCGSAGIMLAQHTQSPEFDPQHRLNQA